MYHVVGIGITVFLLYFLSYILYLGGIISKALHRRIWNFILAGTFLFAATAGVFLALQVTYKWEIPFVKAILKWHVEFGTGLAFTGLLHLIWHFTYFTKGNKPDTAEPPAPATPKYPRWRIMVNLFAAGFTSTAVQLLLMREIMNISGGYELVAGSFLCSWLAGSATGSSAARHSKTGNLARLNLIFVLSIILSVFLLLVLERIFLQPGETPSYLVSLVFTLIVLLPFTFMSGFLFIFLVKTASFADGIHPGKSFSAETAGGVIAGIIISILSFKILDTYQMIMIVTIIFLAYTLAAWFIELLYARILMLSTILILAIVTVFTSPDKYIRSFLLRGIKVVSTSDTPYGNITAGNYLGEESIYYDHRLVKYKNDQAEREENVHYALLQNRVPAKVLVISGDLSSALTELGKYDVKKICFVERDPMLIKLQNSRLTGTSPSVELINSDAFTYLRETTGKFDIVLLLVPPPSTLLLNRYYTTDFFSIVAGHLNKDGVFLCSPGQGDDYFSKESMQLYSSVFNSLSPVFKNILPVVGNKLYYIAGQDSLSNAFCRLTEAKGIKNTFVSCDFLSDDLTESRTRQFLARIDRKTEPNTLEKPAACYHFQIFNLSRSQASVFPSLVILAIILFIPTVSLKRRNFLMYFSSGALAGYEIILLVLVQSAAGNMYQVTGLVIAGIMAGLAAGSSFVSGLSAKKIILLSSAVLVIFYFSMALVSSELILIRFNAAFIAVAIAISIIPSFCTGLIFRSMTDQESNPASVYIADLAGSALTLIVISGIAVPLLGTDNSLFIIALMIIAGLLFGLSGNK
ncbi:MAG TPA: hypothetical protein VMT63_14430 [Bacteroidales bacterium]|nr:hypothetical protein [Bacteroidales bacterium]